MSVPTNSTPAQLLARLRANLPKALPVSMTATGPAPTAGNDLYEAYIFGLVLEAARSLHYRVQICDATGPARIVHLRRSPGRLCTPISANGQYFTHAELAIGSRPELELHTGVLVVGRSKVLHEADVLLLPKSDAERCRQAMVDPPSHAARLVVEAKYYTKPVNLGTGREFLGLRKDLSSKQLIFVSTVSGSSATALLAGTPSVEYDDGVLPLLAGEQSLLNFFRRLLRDYRDRR